MFANVYTLVYMAENPVTFGSNNKRHRIIKTDYTIFLSDKDMSYRSQ